MQKGQAMSIRPNRFLRLAAPSLSLTLLLVACSGEIGDVGDDDDTTNPGTARLTIVGDRNVVLGLGETTTITVKYTDASGRPLAGAVGFAIVGRADGNTLSAAQGVTDPQGLANVNLTGGATELTFNVRASADQAAAVEWQIALEGQNLPALAAVGSYELDSQFDLVSGIPGSTGDVVNTIIALTDGPNDPASYLLDQLGGTAEDIIDPLRPFVDVIMNQVILQSSPTLVTDLVAVGNAGKIREINEMLASLDYCVVPQTAFSVPTARSAWLMSSRTSSYR